VCPQHVNGTIIKVYDPAPGIGFRGLENQAFQGPAQRLCYRYSSGFQVHVPPPQAKGFSATYTSVGDQMETGEQRVFFLPGVF
jgi:hypothetical protein